MPRRRLGPRCEPSGAERSTRGRPARRLRPAPAQKPGRSEPRLRQNPSPGLLPIAPARGELLWEQAPACDVLRISRESAGAPARTGISGCRLQRRRRPGLWHCGFGRRDVAGLFVGLRLANPTYTTAALTNGPVIVDVPATPHREQVGTEAASRSSAPTRPSSAVRAVCDRDDRLPIVPNRPTRRHRNRGRRCARGSASKVRLK